MRILIAYATKHGATQELAERIAAALPNSEILEVSVGATVDLSEFDVVALGSSLMAGNIRRELKQFIAANAEALRRKRIGLFLSGLQESDAGEHFKRNFPQEMLSDAIATAFLGGIFDPEKCGIIERKIIKVVTRLDTYTSTLDDEKIAKFARTLADE